MQDFVIEFVRLCNGTIGKALQKTVKTEDGLALVLTTKVKVPRINVTSTDVLGTWFDRHLMVLIHITEETIDVWYSTHLKEELQLIHESSLSDITPKELHELVCEALLYKL